MNVHRRGTENTDMAQRILSPLDPALALEFSVPVW